MQVERSGGWRPRFRIRTIMGLVVVIGLSLSAQDLAVEPYRRASLRETNAVSRIRSETGVNVLVGTTKVGPAWLHRLAGPSRQHHFERVRTLSLVGAAPDVVEPYAREFEQLGAVISD